MVGEAQRDWDHGLWERTVVSLYKVEATWFKGLDSEAWPARATDKKLVIGYRDGLLLLVMRMIL